MLKEKIRKGLPVVGMYLGMGDIASARIAGLTGYDYVWIDLEHSNITLEQLLAQIIAVHAGGTAVIVRVPQDDLTYTKKVLEMGVDGIIFPMIRSAEQANRQIASTLYPPKGERGFGPLNAIGYNYGGSHSADYIQKDEESLCRFIQIEHKGAVEELDEILKNPYIDGYILGPCDLSGSYGVFGDVNAPVVTEVVEDVVERVHRAQKSVGLATFDIGVEGLRHWKSLGVDMITAGADFDFIRRLAEENLLNLRKIYCEGE